jgi:outer membrane cobalamin receptor
VDTVVVTATRVARDALEVPAAIDRIDAADLGRSMFANSGTRLPAGGWRPVAP